MTYHVIDGQVRPVVRGFDDSNGVIVPAGLLTPEDAARHAYDFEDSDLEDLSLDAVDAVVRVRVVRCRGRR